MDSQSENKADIWLAGTQAMVTANKTKNCWDENFINPAKKSTNIIPWTKQDFIYMRIFTELTTAGNDADQNVQLYISKSDHLLAPRNNWMSLYTDCALGKQPIRRKDAEFAVNAHPFILSGLYDWEDYTLIAYYGKGLDTLPQTITEDFFKTEVWATMPVKMAQDMPFIVNYTVPTELLSEKRLCTQVEPKELFQVEVVDSMVRELNVQKDGNTILFNGTGTRQAAEVIMIYFTLNTGADIPEAMKIITVKA